MDGTQFWDDKHCIEEHLICSGKNGFGIMINKTQTASSVALECNSANHFKLALRSLESSLPVTVTWNQLTL